MTFPEDHIGELDLADRHALRRVAGLSTELTDITEVEYRALRLERVVLIGVWTEGALAGAENSLTTPLVVIWPMAFAPDSVNQSAPSGPAATTPENTAPNKRGE